MNKTQSRYKTWNLPVLLALTIGTILIILHNQEKKQDFQTEEGLVFGTTFHAKYQYDINLHDSIMAELNKVDASLSMFNPRSTIARINNGEDTKVDAMILDVWQLSCKISEASDGAFDPTCGPLVNAWGFGFREKKLPDSLQVDSLKQLVGWQKVKLQNGKITKENPNVTLDFSAIAKGYGVDAVANLFRRKGIHNFMIEIGGEIVANGNNPKGEIWRIGINKPDDDSTSTNNAIQNVIELNNNAVATSGNYRNFYIQNGRKISHTIDPRTGYPTQQDILSSTVVAPTCAMADGFATSFMVLGLDRAKALLEKNPQLEAYFIYSDEEGNFQTWFTKGFERMIK